MTPLAIRIGLKDFTEHPELTRLRTAPTADYLKWVNVPDTTDFQIVCTDQQTFDMVIDALKRSGVAVSNSLTDN